MPLALKIPVTTDIADREAVRWVPARWLRSQIHILPPGFNLKITDMQAACLAQLDRAQSFIRTRKENFERLMSGLKDLHDLILLPKATLKSDPSWFGFPITLTPKIQFLAKSYRRL